VRPVAVVPLDPVGDRALGAREVGEAVLLGALLPDPRSSYHPL